MFNLLPDLAGLLACIWQSAHYILSLHLILVSEHGGLQMSPFHTMPSFMLASGGATTPATLPRINWRASKPFAAWWEPKPQTVERSGPGQKSCLTFPDWCSFVYLSSCACDDMSLGSWRSEMSVLSRASGGFCRKASTAGWKTAPPQNPSPSGKHPHQTPSTLQTLVKQSAQRSAAALL